MFLDSYEQITRDDRKKLSVLIVEDHVGSALIISKFLSNLDCDVKIVHDGIEALGFMKSQNVDLLVLDWMLPHFNGLDLIKSLEKYISMGQLTIVGDTLPVALCSAKDHRQILIPETQHLQIVDFWEKNLGWNEIKTQATQIIKQFKRGSL